MGTIVSREREVIAFACAIYNLASEIIVHPSASRTFSLSAHGFDTKETFLGTYNIVPYILKKYAHVYLRTHD